MKLLYAQSNYARLPKYRMQTAVLRGDSGLVVEKRAVLDEGATHVLEIKNNHTLIQKGYQTLKLPKILRVGKKSIRYEHIAGKNLQVELEEALFSKSYVKANAIVKNFLHWFSKIESQETNYKDLGEFSSFLGIPLTELKEFSTSIVTLKPAILDFKLANLIPVKKEMYLVDTEWVYDFHIPSKFILWRTLFNMLINLQGLIQYSASKEFPGYRLSVSHICPISWWNLFGISIKEYKKFAKWESEFQKYVTGTKFDINSILYPTIETTEDFEIVDEYQTTPSLLNKNHSQLLTHTQETQIKNKISTIQSQIDQLEKDLLKIKSAKFYKLWQMGSRFFKLISK